MIQITRASTPLHLEQISALQQQNLRQHISAEEAASQGFLSAEYAISFLQEMHRYAPAIIALAGNEVAGYALVATKDARNGHPLLKDLFLTIDALIFKGENLGNLSYVVVGQLCVAKEYRGMGLVNRLYEHFRESLSGDFRYCITDVAQANQRSLTAHKRTGFQVIDSLNYGGIGWDIVLWDWNQQR